MLNSETSMRLLAASLLYAITSFFPAYASAGVVVVVSSSSPVTSLSPADISGIFLGKIGSYPDGNEADPLDQHEGSTIRKEFYLKISGKTQAQLAAYWARIIFAGDGQPPQQVADDEKVKNILSQDPYAIGYIDSNSVDKRVRVIYTP